MHYRQERTVPCQLYAFMFGVPFYELILAIRAGCCFTSCYTHNSYRHVSSFMILRSFLTILASRAQPDGSVHQHGACIGFITSVFHANRNTMEGDSGTVVLG